MFTIYNKKNCKDLQSFNYTGKVDGAFHQRQKNTKTKHKDNINSYNLVMVYFKAVRESFGYLFDSGQLHELVKVGSRAVPEPRGQLPQQRREPPQRLQLLAHALPRAGQGAAALHQALHHAPRHQVPGHNHHNDTIKPPTTDLSLQSKKSTTQKARHCVWVFI